MHETLPKWRYSQLHESAMTICDESFTITEPPFCNWPPFSNSVQQAQFCLNPLTSFFVQYFLLRCSLYKYEFCEIYYCMGNMKCYNYIHTTSLDVLHATYESQEWPEQNCQCSPIFEEGGVKLAAAMQEFQSPLQTCMKHICWFGFSRVISGSSSVVHGQGKCLP